MMEPILNLQSVSKVFIKRLTTAEKIANLLGSGHREQMIRAVDRVDLKVEQGEVIGLVGESGCGKSTLGRVIAGIQDPTSGRVRFRGEDLHRLPPDQAARRSLKIQMVFQDPFASLNPRKRVKTIIGQAAKIHGVVKPENMDDYIDDLMRRVGLDPSYKRRYPHQFSGGQRQRIGIARALAVKPEFLVCDEAVAALDVSIQAQVLNLFMDLREEFDLTYLFISHDLSIVKHISDHVAIMYLGRIVETSPTRELFSNPNHPYTRALLDEIPRIDRRQREYGIIKGEIPSPLNPPSGCHFHTRCPHVFKRCSEEPPKLQEIAQDRRSACHLNDSP
jgi:peptide/nickel transport system ATP-binding protein